MFKSKKQRIAWLIVCVAVFVPSFAALATIQLNREERSQLIENTDQVVEDKRPFNRINCCMPDGCVDAVSLEACMEIQMASLQRLRSEEAHVPMKKASGDATCGMANLEGGHNE